MPFTTPTTACCVLSLLAGAFFAFVPALAFNTYPARPSRIHSQSITAVQAKKADANGDDKGYRFGDISKRLASRFTKRVEQVTGKEYELGDLSRHFDAKAKEKICEITGQDSYSFGDMSVWADTVVKEKVCELTGKDSYEVGDLSKEILRRATSGEMKWEEVLVLLKMMLSLGASFSPVAGMLPAKVLIELLNYSILAQAGEMVTSAISTELDRRMKRAFTGDPEYALGDITKRKLLDFIGSDTYEFGSLTRTVIKKMNAEDGGAKDNEDAGGSAGTGSSVLFADSSNENLELNNEQVLKELAAWDNAFNVPAGGKVIGN